MMATIRAIDQSSVHRIHAGQVVLDLQGAIKELVENSLDAGSSSIDVRIKNQGLDSIEVIDNGSGIAELDWPTIALKHHTSKLPSLSDLPHVTTFGFRGEALSSLCALCDSVTVTTATTETAPMAAVIQLDRDGRVKDSTGRVARPRGTTISLSGLFVPLPVRRREFERTIKREFPKALIMLQSYALVPASVSKDAGREGVKLRVETVALDKKGKRSTMLSTDGRGSLRSSVVSVWGPKALEGVLDVQLELEVEVDAIMARREGIEQTAQMVKVSGLISSAAWGQGRSSADRQFYYINGRPCDLKQVAKTVNEVYKSFNTHQVPLAILDFQLPPESVDINVSPDKRTIFLHSEANLLVALRAALEDFFAPSRSSFAVEGASKTVKATETQSELKLTEISRSAMGTEAVTEPGEEDVVEVMEESNNARPEAGPSRPRRNLPSPVPTETIVFETEIDSISDVQPFPSVEAHRKSSADQSESPIRKRSVQQILHTATASWSPDRKRSKSGPVSTMTSGKASQRRLKDRLAGFASQSQGHHQAIVTDAGEDEESSDGNSEDVHEGTEVDELESETDEGRDTGQDSLGEDDAMSVDSASDAETQIEEEPESDSEVKARRAPSSRLVSQEITSSEPKLDSPRVASPSILLENDALLLVAGPSKRPLSNTPSYRDEITSTTVQGEVKLRFDLPRLQRRSQSARERRKESGKQSKQARDAFDIVNEGRVADAAGIRNKDASKAEEALSRVISKSDFAKMEVLGQFNKGFIIARLRSGEESTSSEKKDFVSDDLFIIDQHACDEKYNFETLQRTTVMKAQTLIKPRPLQLTAADEIVAFENLDVLRANGFEVAVDEDKAPGRGERIRLSAMPVSKETTFDFKDLEQLLHMLSDGARPAGQMVRCSKARTMFAMRACRKSVMIGKSLTKPQMIQLLNNMGTIDQPWNCPHGRPTMRHLTKIDRPRRSRSGTDRVDWTRWDVLHA